MECICLAANGILAGAGGMRFPSLAKAGFCFALLNASSAATSVVVTSGDWVGPTNAGSIAEPTINESSGLAPSLRTADVYWTNNDSGGEPVLYAIDGTGKYLGSVRFAGAVNIDWEDCASFSVNGKAYLLAADVGDNYAKRIDCKLYIIEEPDPAELDPAHELTAEIAWQLPVTFPDGPREKVIRRCAQHVPLDECRLHCHGTRACPHNYASLHHSGYRFCPAGLGLPFTCGALLLRLGRILDIYTQLNLEDGSGFQGPDLGWAGFLTFMHNSNRGI